MKLTGPYSSSIRSFVLVAPPEAPSRSVFWKKLKSDYSEYERLIGEMQKLRGGIYLNDGAIGPEELSADGRHVLPTDEQSWHLLTVDACGRVLGCTRYLQHSNAVRFPDLRLSHASLARCQTWGPKLRVAVNQELRSAREARFSYVEVGGWAMAEEVRGTTEALRSVLATYAWSELIGGALGVSTATERNGSACILRRLGGKPLVAQGAELPAYFDPAYNCNMEMIRFDSREPNPRYASAIEELKATLLSIPVICPERPIWQHFGPSYAPSPAVLAATAVA